MTCRRDLIPQGIPAIHLHKKKIDTSQQIKVIRFSQPVVYVKNVPAICHNLDHTQVHVLFQSTSSCNFSPVNSSNECSMNRKRIQRGQGKNKRE